jgi:hypothetical protein
MEDKDKKTNLTSMTDALIKLKGAGIELGNVLPSLDKAQEADKEAAKSCTIVEKNTTSSPVALYVEAKNSANNTDNTKNSGNLLDSSFNNDASRAGSVNFAFGIKADLGGTPGSKRTIIMKGVDCGGLVTAPLATPVTPNNQEPQPSR